jgi:hypothetical protein
MTHPAVNSDQVAALFSERQRYESWLSTLESRRATTPPHIYHRVHADYTARLQRVIEQLATHRAVLQELESNLMDRLTSLDIDEAKHRDEAAEAELRAAVGELTAEHHREVLERANAALGTVTREREQVSQELARLRAILEAGGIAPAAPRPAASTPEPAAAEAESASPPRRASGPVQSAEVQAAAKSSADWDLSFEKTPAPEPPKTAPTPKPESQRGSGEIQLEQSAQLGPFDDLEFLKTMVDSRSSGEGVAVGSGAGAAGGGAGRAASAGNAAKESAGSAAGDGGSVASREQAKSAGASAASPTPPQPTVVRVTGEGMTLKEGAEQVKTLKCQECGTLNYPTEWYCERCGAELAAL